MRECKTLADKIRFLHIFSSQDRRYNQLHQRHQHKSSHPSAQTADIDNYYTRREAEETALKSAANIDNGGSTNITRTCYI
jgi:hypothetical protein